MSVSITRYRIILANWAHCLVEAHNKRGIMIILPGNGDTFSLIMSYSVQLV